MFNTLELWIAYRFFRSKAKDKFVSIIYFFSFLGIALGVATLIIVMAVMRGYEVELVERFKGMDGDLVIDPYGFDLNDLSAEGAAIIEEEYDNFISKVRSLEEVEYLYPMVQSQGLINSSNTASGVMVRGIDPADISSKQILREGIVQGSLANYDEDSIIIGIDLALKMDLFIGDEVKLVSPANNVTLMGFIPKYKTFRVAAIFDIGMYEHNLSTVFIDRQIAQVLFALTDVNRLEVGLSSKESIKATGLFAKQITKKITQLAGNRPVSVYNIADRSASIEEALRVERVVMYVILSLIILVAVFNIVSSMVILVKDKHKSIAILKTFGMEQNQILRIFMLAGMYIGVIGTILGCFIGVVFSLNIEYLKNGLEKITGSQLFDPVVYYLTKLPVILEFNSVMIVAGTSLFLSILATIYPSLRAAKLKPAEVLRSD